MFVYIIETTTFATTTLRLGIESLENNIDSFRQINFLIKKTSWKIIDDVKLMLTVNQSYKNKYVFKINLPRYEKIQIIIV
jgi:hypothetical protein